MLLKYEVVEAKYAQPRIERLRSGSSAIDVHSGCTVPEEAGIPGPWETYHASDVSEEIQQSYISYSNWIRYTNSNLKSFNYCHHVKQRAQAAGGNVVKLYSNQEIERFSDCEVDMAYNGFHVVDTISDHITLTADTLLRVGATSVPAGENSWDPYLPIQSTQFEDKVRVLDRIALDVMVPELDSGFSLPRFVFELIELKMLYRNVEYLLTRGLGRLIRDLLGKPLNQLSRTWLASVFGWLPLVKDIKTIYSKMVGFEDVLVQYFKLANRRVTLHFEKGLAPETFMEDPSWFSSESTEEIWTDEDEWRFADQYFAGLSYKYATERNLSNLSYHATMDFTYQVPALEGYGPSMQGLWVLLDYWGIQLSPQDVWNVIPFSFVVDWVLSVGPWLEQFEIKWLPKRVVIHDYCRSFSYKLSETKRILPELTHFYMSVGGPDVASDWRFSPSSDSVSCDTESYYRLPGVPVLPAAGGFEWRTPGGFAIVSSAALLATRPRNSRLGRLLYR